MNQKKILYKISVGVFLAALLMLGVFLGYLACRANVTITRNRLDQPVITIQNVSCQETERADAPQGIVRQYTFTPGTLLTRDSCLAFYTTHQYVDIFIDGESVYSLRPSEESSIVRTVGSNWVMIPLYREDAGARILVEITPVYAGSADAPVEFLVGSALEIYAGQLRQDLPLLLLSILTILSGIVLLSIGIYLLSRRKYGADFTALGVSAVMIGLWRLLDLRFAAFLLPNQTVLLYYISLTMMMLIVIPLTNSLIRRENSDSSPVLDCFNLCTALIFMVQLVLQGLGVFDLQQSLPLSHGLIILGVLIVLVTILSNNRKNPASRAVKTQWIFALIFAVGELADILIFYIRRSASLLPFTLLAFGCYVVYTGIAFLYSYNEQKTQLIEKENQLTQSRITMMLSQIRSHFVFNILNAISGMCKYDPEKADRTVVCFARYLRTNIDIMQEDQPVTFHSALRHLEDYVVLEQIRFGDQVCFETDITVDEFMIPPLILQPIVENAIRHGIMPKPNGGTIILRTREEGDYIRIEIQDDGVGFDPSSAQSERSVGLRNVRFRVQHIMNGTLEIHSTPNRGTTAIITIPKLEA